MKIHNYGSDYAQYFKLKKKQKEGMEIENADNGTAETCQAGGEDCLGNENADTDAAGKTGGETGTAEVEIVGETEVEETKTHKRKKRNPGQTAMPV